MQALIQRFSIVNEPVTRFLNFISPVADLIVRLWVANVFWKSALTKVRDWDGTLWLFANEYHVPLLPPTAAAVLGTAAEITLPVFIVLGLGGRLPALFLFFFNIVAVVSYYASLGEVGLKDHWHWGLLLLLLAVHGPGKLSLDHLICRRYGK
jgi:putative oxidoreductase